MTRCIVLVAIMARFGWGQTTITWSLEALPSTHPGYVGYTDIAYDPVSKQDIVFAAPAGNQTIFYSSLWSWNASLSSNQWTHLTPNGGTETTLDSCTADASNVPGERHVSMLAAVDTKRNLLWIEGGVNVQCNGGTAPNLNPRQDIYYRTLTANPTQGVWTKAAMSTVPDNSNYGPFRYDSDHDILVAFGGTSGGQGHTWIYCPTVPVGGGTPSGTLSAAQTRGGCAVADDWRQITLSGGPPPGVNNSDMVFVPGSVFGTNDGHMIQFGGLDGSLTVCHNTTWSLDLEAGTWTETNNGTGAPPLDSTNNCQNDLAFYSAGGTILLHRSADGTDWKYTPTSGSAGTWTQLTSAGTSYKPSGQDIAYDANCTCLVSWDINTINGNPEIWQGVVSGGATFSITLTIQEELPIGTTGCSTAASCGVARANEPFTMGVPLPDSSTNGTNTVNNLGLTGCSAGQFRALETWASGNIKWVEVSGIISSLSAGGTTTCTLNNGGSGNFGGSNLATNNTPDANHIQVATGTSTYTIKKSNFNVIDTATVGSTSIITASSAATRGLIVTGPANPGTDCSVACTTPFSSANDGTNSTCTIEENGPVKAVIKCTGDLVDGSSHVYMHHTTRETFWQNKDQVKVVNSLRNADNNSSGFNTAFKGFAAYTMALDLASAGGAGTNKYSFGGRASTIGPTTYTGSENAQLIQLYSNRMEGSGIGVWDTANIATSSTQSIIPRTSGGTCTDNYCYPDGTRVNEGYSIKDGATSLETGTRSQYPVGWCDSDNASGAGVLMGGWYFGAYWPKSCELNSGGGNLVYGLWPSEISGFNYWIAWPQYQTHTIFLQFHTAALGAPTNTFLMMQYPLIAQFGLMQLNSSGVLPQGMILPDPALEDAFYKSIADANGYSESFACCVTDTSASAQAQTTRIYGWGQGSAANQADLRWAGRILFQTRGFTSRYLYADMFERFVMDNALPRSDFAGGWRGTADTLNITGFPADTSTGSANSLRSWIDRLHAHVYGIFDTYGMTGDEFIHDFINQGFYDWLDNTTLTANTSNGPQRAIGVILMMEQHFHDFATATGDSTAATNAWTVAEQAMNAIRATMNTYNAATAGNPCGNSTCSAAGDTGTDPSRGVTWITGSWTAWNNPPATGNNNPGGPGTSRNSGQLQEGIMEEGMTEYLLARGTSFGTYESDRDLILGNSFFVRNEWTVTGLTPAINNGTRTGAALDYCNDPNAPCSAGSHNTWPVYFAPNAEYWTWIPFSVWYGDNLWVQSFKDNLNQDYTSTGCANMSECGIYSMAAAVYRALNPPPPLGNLVITGFVNNGGGSYTVSWTVPTGATGYLFKWGPKPISYNLGFDNGQTLTFVQAPTTKTTWWAATNVSNEPAPATPGTTQSYTFSTGTTGLTAPNFSLKAFGAQSQQGAVFTLGILGGGLMPGNVVF